MLADKSRRNDLLTVFHVARRYARALEQREKRDHGYGMLLFLLGLSIAGLIFLLIRMWT
jgi:hypothetical protein